MRVLVVKLTSMGDVLHVMPALSDLQRAVPELKVDWMVEDSFAELPLWHPCVERVIPVSTRRWRSLNRQNISEFFAFVKDLRRCRYDAVVDAQGLLKSAGLSWFAKLAKTGKRIGFSSASIKESPAARFYHTKVDVPRHHHAIDRLRQLFAQGFDYALFAEQPMHYQLKLPSSHQVPAQQHTILFFHGTTWNSKHLPDQRWRELAELVTADGYQVKLSWGSDKEHQRAHWIAKDLAGVHVLPKSSLGQLAAELQSVAGVIAVDTGLGHMAAGFGIPAVSVYGATDAGLTGAKGQNQHLLQTDYPCSPCLLKHCNKLTEQIKTPPCYEYLSAATIWQSLYAQIV